MFTVEFYTNPDGTIPVADWLDTLRSKKTVFRVVARLNRIVSGNLGDVKAVGGGVWGLRFHFGPGYRVYYCRVGSDVVVLLCGGDKSGQARDVKTAKRYLVELEGRTE